MNREKTLREALDVMTDEVRRLDPDSLMLPVIEAMMKSIDVSPRTGKPLRQWGDKRIDHSNDATIATRYMSGESTYMIAAALNCSVPTVLRALARKGIQMRGPGEGQIASGQIQDQKRIEHIKEQLSLGFNLSDIGRQLGITRERVRQICVKNKIDTKPDLSPTQKRAVADYLRGDSLTFVAAAYGVAPYSVQKWVLRSGNSMRMSNKQGGPRPETLAASKKAAEMYNRGVKIDEIAETLGYTSSPPIYRLLALSGIKPKRRPRKEMGV